MEITAAMVKDLREKTNVGMMDCKKALQDSGGDMEKAVDLLRQKGLAKAMKRAGKEASEGVVQSYVHAGGRIGVLLEVNCETDFAAKSSDFLEFAKNVAMHIAAANPLGIQQEDIPADVAERERAIYMAQAAESGKPANILEKNGRREDAQVLRGIPSAPAEVRERPRKDHPGLPERTDRQDRREDHRSPLRTLSTWCGLSGRIGGSSCGPHRRP